MCSCLTALWTHTPVCLLLYFWPYMIRHIKPHLLWLRCCQSNQNWHLMNYKWNLTHLSNSNMLKFSNNYSPCTCALHCHCPVKAKSTSGVYAFLTWAEKIRFSYAWLWILNAFSYWRRIMQECIILQFIFFFKSIITFSTWLCRYYAHLKYTRAALN